MEGTVIPAVGERGKKELFHDLGHVRETIIASSVGQTATLLVGVAQMFVSVMLVLIAVFVWFSASQESAAVQMHSVLDGMTIGQVMRSEVQALAPATPLGRAAGRLVGILPFEDCRNLVAADQALANYGLKKKGAEEFNILGMRRNGLRWPRVPEPEA